MQHNNLKLKNFNDIDFDYKKSDLHIHSDWTDGENSLEEIIAQAQNLGLHAVAFTDHIRETSDYFLDYFSKIKELRHNCDIILFAGFEAKIKNFKGEIDVCPKIQEIADIRIASVHRFPFADKLFPAKDFSKETAQAIELTLCLAGIEKGGFDVLGHAGGMCIKQFGEFPMEYFEKIIIACKQSNIAFELNSGYHFDIYPQLEKILIKHNPFVTYGSDAHQKRDIAHWFVSSSAGCF